MVARWISCPVVQATRGLHRRRTFGSGVVRPAEGDVDEREVVADPDGRGGVVATAGTRRLDLTLPVLVDVALDGLGDAVEELWR